MSKNDDRDKDNLDLSKFQSLQEEEERLRGMRGGRAENNAKPLRATLYYIVDTLEAIEELLIIRNRLDRLGKIIIIVISILFITVSFIN